MKEKNDFLSRLDGCVELWRLAARSRAPIEPLAKTTARLFFKLSKKINTSLSWGK